MNKEQIFLKNYLPHNFLAEKMLLTCLLTNFPTVEKISKILPIEAFYFKNHQEIYKAILNMYINGWTIDVLSLATFLQEKGLLARIGGIKILLELLNQIPNRIYLNDYIRLVKDKFLRRLLIKFGYKIINSGYITNIPLENLLYNLEIEFITLLNKNKISEFSTSTRILNDLFSELKEKFLNPTLPGLPSGFSCLDSFTQGFQKSDFIILAGRPSLGKTALSLNIVLNVIRISRLPILFFSLEMSKEQIMYRILSIETSINQTRLKNGILDRNDWIKLNKIIKIVSKLPFFIDDTSNLSVEDIRLKIKMILLEETKIGLIIIDYLQLMQNLKIKGENRVQELSQITRALKILAREFNIPIIALSQLNRSVDSRLNQKPILSDLRESGSIEQDADLILMLYQNKQQITNQIKNQKLLITEIIIAKHRNGSTGKVQLIFKKDQMKFLEFKKKDSCPEPDSNW